MARGISLFKILGIRISLDYTWFIVFVLFAWSLSRGYFPQNIPGLSGPMYLAMGAVSALMLFICVLIHELSHSYTANRLGLDIKEITLFIFGGVARLTREPEDAMTELKVAVAGPAASLALGVFFILLKKALASVLQIPVITSVVGFLATINFVLLVFNMIPGFPLDGGRVLRAIWWARTGDVKNATRVSTQIGKAFAMFLIVFGFFQIISGYFVQGLWAILIGAFMQQAAETSYRQLVLKMAIEGIRVKDIMTKNVVTVDSDLLLSDVIERYFFNYHFVSFPVTSNGKVVGLLTLNRVREAGREKWGATAVRDAMEKLTADMTLHPNDTAQHALARMVSDDVGRYPVLDEAGSLKGILSRRDIMKTMEFKAELEG
ncbi:MAG: site-2 protease family protein [Deltaproteobacteria bacterium]|nr:site-2 protease family protein [Deltaproteobacteria bacterium]